MVPEEDHHQGETDDADQGPQHLLFVAGSPRGRRERALHQIEPVDHHQAQPIE